MRPAPRVKEARGCFLQYLHRGDPDVNHVDLLTSLLIVRRFFFFLVVPFLRLGVFPAVGAQVHVCRRARARARVCFAVCLVY